MSLHSEAIQAYEKIQSIVSSSPEVMYQIANAYEMAGKTKHALKWYSVLVTKVPSDPHVLLKLGSLHIKEHDETQAFHFNLESFR